MGKEGKMASRKGLSEILQDEALYPRKSPLPSSSRKPLVDGASSKRIASVPRDPSPGVKLETDCPQFRFLDLFVAQRRRGRLCCPTMPTRACRTATSSTSCRTRTTLTASGASPQTRPRGVRSMRSLRARTAAWTPATRAATWRWSGTASGSDFGRCTPRTSSCRQGGRE